MSLSIIGFEFAFPIFIIIFNLALTLFDFHLITVNDSLC